MVSKSICAWILKGVCSSSGNIMTFWKTNFNMPVPYLFGGCTNCNEGWMDARYGPMSGGTISLSGHYAGYETALADGLWRWETGSGECLNGIACVKIDWWRGVTKLHGYSFQNCVNIPEFYITWTEAMVNSGIAGWEFCSNERHCTTTQATQVSGDNVSILTKTCYVCFTNTPSTTQCSGSLKGNIWVEGNNLNYINANCWEHSMVGNCYGSGGSPGAIWIDTVHAPSNIYLNWVGSTGNLYKAKWSICQFCSSFTAGPPVNPSPGASYKGALWVDGQFGLTHLAYIGCDGNKYLTGAGEYPYIAP